MLETSVTRESDHATNVNVNMVGILCVDSVDDSLPVMEPKGLLLSQRVDWLDGQSPALPINPSKFIHVVNTSFTYVFTLILPLYEVPR